MSISLALYGLLSLLTPHRDSWQNSIRAEFLCWSMILLGARLYLSYRHTQALVDLKNKRQAYIALTLVGAIACRCLADVAWVVPYLTPILHFLTREKHQDVLPGRSSEKKAPEDGAVILSHRRRLGLTYCSTAIISSVLLWGGASVFAALAALLFLAASTILMLGLSDTHEVQPSWHVETTLYQIGLRVWPVLTVMYLCSTSEIDQLNTPGWIDVSISAGLKSIVWLSLILLCIDDKAIDLSRMTTFAVCTSGILEQFDRFKIGCLTIMSIVPLAQTSTYSPKVFSRKLAVIYAMVVLISSLLSASSNDVPYTQEAFTSLARFLQIPKPTRVHPMEQLHLEALAKFHNLVDHQSTTMSAALAEYRRRYKRSPPPNFDVWFEMAQEANMILVDEFDGLMQSLEPFWSLSPQQLRDDIESLRDSRMLWHVTIKDHIVESSDDGWAWTHINTWLSSYVGHLPNMTAMFNSFDEPRVLVPHERRLGLAKSDSHFTPGSGHGTTNVNKTSWVDLERRNWWDLAQNACLPTSPARQFGQNESRNLASGIRFLQNAGDGSDMCQSVGLGSKHAFFSSPTSFLMIDKPVPIFSQAAPAPFSDILFPSQFYTNRMDIGEYDMSSDVPWNQKTNTLYWAGTSTGGHSTAQNWHHHHRQRFVDLVSLSPNEYVQFLHSAPSGIWRPYTVQMANLSDIVDVKITGNAQCDEDACELMKQHFHIKDREPLTSTYQSKLLFDIDGNSFSGRFWRLLYSKSAVLKQTVFREFHDDWLTPWVHYVPVSLDMTELPEILRYLLRTPEGDRLAETIGTQGKDWAERVLRKRDVELIFFRILLEYGRLLDDNRDSLHCCEAVS